MKNEQPPINNNELPYTGKIEISPDFFDKILPALVDKQVINVHQMADIHRILREESADKAAIKLTEILKSTD